MPPGLENLTPIERVLMKPFDGNLDLEHPFISFSNGKKYQIMDGMNRVIFYAIRTRKSNKIWGKTKRITIVDNTGQEALQLTDTWTKLSQR